MNTIMEHISGNEYILCTFNVAKYNLGKVRLELMQSAVFPCTVRAGRPLWRFAGLLCRIAFSLAVLFADLCGSISRHFISHCHGSVVILFF